ncbi:17182_t:CDS:1, partial [Racocetra persica]
GEKAGIASSRKIKRKIIGKKGDGYVREFGSKPTEWAATEGGAQWKRKKDTKIIKESGLNLPKTLKDIFI